MSKCKGCGAPIVWGEWESSGRPTPLDPNPNPKGNLALVAGKVHSYGPEDARLHRDRYMPHHATCPKADDFRPSRRQRGTIHRSAFALLVMIALCATAIMLEAVRRHDEIERRLRALENDR
jgi:hypothetical protein